MRIPDYSSKLREELTKIDANPLPFGTRHQRRRNIGVAAKNKTSN